MARAALAGQRVLITGAARGIGAHTARLAAAQGARLSLVGLEAGALRGLAHELDAHWAECDVTDQAGLKTAIDAAAHALGGVDAVVANAGIAPMAPVSVAPVDALARTVEVNLTGVIRTVSATLPHLIAARGYALLVSSASAFTGMPGLAAYGATKAGVEQFGNVLRQEVAHLGVRVGLAHPAWVDTEMVRGFETLDAYLAARRRLPWPLRSVTTAPECAAALVRALRRRSRRVHVPAALAGVRTFRALTGGRFADWVTAWATGGGAMVAEMERELAARAGGPLPGVAAALPSQVDCTNSPSKTGETGQTSA